mmetsp:Transcript_46331/g.92499  ORF Transcript_46331/g.92499 Transcript_46331/m.92499 type:complete len:293 (+) Transcript_46331:297-1175(+)
MALCCQAAPWDARNRHQRAKCFQSPRVRQDGRRRAHARAAIPMGCRARTTVRPHHHTTRPHGGRDAPPHPSSSPACVCTTSPHHNHVCPHHRCRTQPIRERRTHSSLSSLVRLSSLLLGERFDAEDVILRSEGADFAQAGETIPTNVHELGSVCDVLLEQPNLGKAVEEVGQRTTNPRVSGWQRREQPGFGRLQVTPPGEFVISIKLLPPVHEVEMLLDRETRLADHCQILLDARRTCGTVAVQMPFHELYVFGVVLIPPRQRHVLHGDQPPARLEQPVRLLESLGAVLAVE